MTEFKTPSNRRIRSRLEHNSEFQTPIKIPASPFLKQIGYGCGVNVFQLERSPRVGCTRSPWAIKKRNGWAKDKKYDERIRLEAEILRNLNHKNIVGFRAFTISETGAPCLAMEQLDISLGDMIEEKAENVDGPFEASEIQNVTFEIAKGLHYLHYSVHILHGDIKSYNILVSKNLNTVKICDFGVSVPITDNLELDKSNGDFVYTGTECWNAPEIINGHGPVTNKTDMWAYGLVIWEMIALTPPHVEINESMNISAFDDLSFDDSMKLHDDSNLQSFNESLQLVEESCKGKYGTRPALPAIEIGMEYTKVLEIFFLCTEQDYKTRPSAQGVVSYFDNHVKLSSTCKKSD